MLSTQCRTRYKKRQITIIKTKKSNNQLKDAFKFMDIKKRKFPYQIHLALGLIWVVIGIFLYSGWEQALWIGVGIVFLIIGYLNGKNK